MLRPAAGTGAAELGWCLSGYSLIFSLQRLLLQLAQGVNQTHLLFTITNLHRAPRPPIPTILQDELKSWTGPWGSLATVGRSLPIIFLWSVSPPPLLTSMMGPCPIYSAVRPT